MEYSQRILKYMEQCSVSAYKLSKATGISESLFSKWKKNPTSDISAQTAAKIADYFFISVDFLLKGKCHMDDEACRIVSDYNQLDAQGKSVVKSVLKAEKSRMKSAELGKLVARGGQVGEPVLTEDDSEKIRKLIENDYPELK